MGEANGRDYIGTDRAPGDKVGSCYDRLDPGEEEIVLYALVLGHMDVTTEECGRLVRIRLETTTSRKGWSIFLCAKLLQIRLTRTFQLAIFTPL